MKIMSEGIAFLITIICALLGLFCYQLFYALQKFPNNFYLLRFFQDKKNYIRFGIVAMLLIIGFGLLAFQGEAVFSSLELILPPPVVKLVSGGASGVIGFLAGKYFIPIVKEGA